MENNNYCVGLNSWMRPKGDRSKLVRHLHNLLVQALLLLLQVLDQVGLFLQQLRDISAALHEPDRPCDGAYALQGVWRRPHAVELHDLADVGSVHEEENEGLGDCEGGDVHNWATERLHAFFQESVTIVVLDSGWYGQDGGVPETHDCEWDRLVAVRRSVEVVVPVQAKLIMVVIDDVVEDLRDEKIIAFNILNQWHH